MCFYVRDVISKSKVKTNIVTLFRFGLPQWKTFLHLKRIFKKPFTLHCKPNDFSTFHFFFLRLQLIEIVCLVCLSVVNFFGSLGQERLNALWFAPEPGLKFKKKQFLIETHRDSNNRPNHLRTMSDNCKHSERNYGNGNRLEKYRFAKI